MQDLAAHSDRQSLLLVCAGPPPAVAGHLERFDTVTAVDVPEAVRRLRERVYDCVALCGPVSTPDIAQSIEQLQAACGDNPAPIVLLAERTTAGLEDVLEHEALDGLADLAWSPALVAAYLRSAIARVKGGRNVVEIQRAILQAAQGDMDEKLHELLDKLRRAESRLIQSEKLAAVTKLVAGIAHEFKNPLTSLSLAVVNLRDAIAASGHGDGAALTRFVDAVSTDAERLRVSVDKLLAFARPEKARRVRVDARDVLQQAAGLVRVRAEALDIRVAVEGGGEPLGVLVDHEAFLQAALNLLTNAIEATPRGCAVSVRCARRGDRVHVAVADEGHGVPDEIAPVIFDLFFTTKPKGSGIGLAQVHVFCDTHGGKVSFENAPRGAVFRLDLPFVPLSGAR